jgi:hypothetical protein
VRHHEQPHAGFTRTHTAEDTPQDRPGQAPGRPTSNSLAALTSKSKR